MYEQYSRQSVPSAEYRALLGSAICVFNSNNAFIIENILRTDNNGEYSWYGLIDNTSGQLKAPIAKTITAISNQEIADLFASLVKKRNRIIHSFAGTDENGETMLFTKDRENRQFVVSEQYLLMFIKDNEQLSQMLYDFRSANT